MAQRIIAKSAAPAPGHYVVLRNSNAWSSTILGLRLVFRKPPGGRARARVEAAIPAALRHDTSWPTPTVLVVTAAEWFGLDDEPTGAWLRGLRRDVDSFLERGHAAAPVELVYATSTLDLPVLERRARRDLRAAPAAVASVLVRLWQDGAPTGRGPTYDLSSLTYELLQALSEDTSGKPSLSAEQHAQLGAVFKQAAKGRPHWRQLGTALGLSAPPKARARATSPRRPSRSSPRRRG